MEQKKRRPRTLGDRVLVRIKDDIVDNQYQFNDGAWEKRTASGLVAERITQEQYDNLKMGTCEGYVVQIGPDAYKGLGSGNPWVTLGQLVTINKWSGRDIVVGDGATYRLISDQDAMVEWQGESLPVDEIPDHLKIEE